MASKTITMYSEKQYELEDIKNKIALELENRIGAELKGTISRELGETKSLLLIFERFYLRTGSYASLTVFLSEYRGYQSADLISAGGKEAYFSYGAEDNFVIWGEKTLKLFGFLSKS